MTTRARLLASALFAVAVAPAAGQPTSATTPREAGGFAIDDAAMASFTPFLGTWRPPPEADIDYRAVLEWGIPGKTVHFAEYDLVEGKPVQRNECLIGYHYGRQRIEFLEFVRDDPERGFEVMNEGTYELREDGALVRNYRSFDPDTSSREYRETWTIEEDGSRLNVIEYRDDEGAWQPWPRGPFRSVRSTDLEPPRVPPA